MSADSINIAPIQQSIQKQKRFIPKPYRDVAQAMEKQFIEHMLDQMSKTVPGQEKKDSSTRFYESMLKSERASLMAENNGGLGIQEMILNKIYPKSSNSHRNLNAYKRNAPNELVAKSINDTVNNFNESKRSVAAKEDSHE